MSDTDSKALREALELCVGRLRAIARDIESGENLRDGIGVICQWANSAEQALAAAPASPAGSIASLTEGQVKVIVYDALKGQFPAEGATMMVASCCAGPILKALQAGSGASEPPTLAMIWQKVCELSDKFVCQECGAPMPHRLEGCKPPAAVPSERCPECDEELPHDGYCKASAP